MGILQQVIEYVDYFDSQSDPRTRGLFLVDNLYLIAAMVILYLVMVFTGPKIMKDKKPFGLKNLILFYNFAMSATNAYICYELYHRASLLNFTWFCTPLPAENDPNAVLLARATWLYFLTKLIEILDTLFFILRKKNNQLSGMHIYHHASVIVYSHLMTKYLPVGISYLPLLFNSGVHVLMYVYYGLSAIGPAVQPYLWWKKYLTLIQIIQFVCGFGIQITSEVIGCNTLPPIVSVLHLMFSISFFVLFGQFYMKSYKKTQKSDQKVVNLKNN
ncbi:Elongation of very long chain fatty acids protein [Sergentomyia squamirostris]